MRDARRARAREIEGPLRQRGGRGVRRLEAWGGGWAREERLSGEPYRVPNACHRTRKRCRVWCTVKRIVAAQSMLHESREKAGQDKEPTSPGEVQDQSVTETSAVTRETGGADLSTVCSLGGTMCADTLSPSGVPVSEDRDRDRVRS